jgi:hypothetical protein
MADACKHGTNVSGCIKAGDFLTRWETISFLTNDVYAKMAISRAAESVKTGIHVALTDGPNKTSYTTFFKRKKLETGF